MVASADFDPRAAQYSLNLRSAPDGVLVPGGDWLLTAAFSRSGQDLALRGIDGHSALVPGYFASDNPPPLLTESGARLSGALVELLAGPRAPLQFAEVELAQASDASGAIGKVVQVEGVVQVSRADGSQAQLVGNDSVFLRDVIQAGPGGKIAIQFVDGTTFALSDGARMTLDELVFNPGGGGNVFSASVLQGTFVFLTGQIAPSGNMDVTTPVGTIGVRGTTVAGRLGIEGTESIFTLLADPDGHVGVVEITNGGGTRILDQERATTRVTSFFVQPGDVTIIDDNDVIQLFDSALEGLRRRRGEAPTDDDTQQGSTGGTDSADTAEASDEAAMDQAAEGLGAFETAAGSAELALLPATLIAPPGAPIPAAFVVPTFTTLTSGGTIDLAASSFTDTGGATEDLQPADTRDTNDPTPPPPPPPNPFTVITGGAGNDTLGGGGATGRLQIAGGGGDDSLTGGDLGDILDGGDGDDTLDAGAGDDVVDGGAGNDLIIGGTGFGNDVLKGGTDIDTVVYLSATQDITVDLTAGTAFGDPVIGTDTLDGIENVISGSGNDTITGDEAANVLDGGIGDDTVAGLAGNDTLLGGVGDDQLTGGAGNDLLQGGGGSDIDTAVFSGKLSDYTVTLEGGQLILTDNRPGGDGTDTLDGIEQVKFADQQVSAADLTNPNLPPSIPVDANESANSVAENAESGTLVGITASATDPNPGDTVTYTLTDAAGGRFAIDAGTGVVTVADGSLLDFESAASHQITVQASSSGGLNSTQTFTITITNMNEAPSLPTDGNGAANQVAEKAASGTTVGITASAVDPDAGDTVTYSLTDDAGGRFAIDAGTGVVTVADGSLLDFEGSASHQITVQASSSGGLNSTQTFTVNLTNVDEALSTPVDVNGSANTIAENAANGTAVGITALAVDPDAGDTVTYGLTDDAGGRFAIDAGTGVVTVADGSLLDFESATSHTITVQASSSGGGTTSQAFAITVANVNEAPGTPSDGNVAANQVSEDAANGTAVGITASAVDPDADDPVTYSLTDDAGGRFAIDASTGIVTVANGSLLDFEGAASHQVTVRATSSGGLNSTQTFTITVTNANELGPVTDAEAAPNTVVETAEVGTAVGITASAVDPDAGDTVTYSLTDDAGGLFTIDENTGVVSVASGLPVGSHSIEVTATDNHGLTTVQIFSIEVTAADNLPPSIPVDADDGANSIAEGADSGALVGITASATDPNPGDAVTYSLTDDAGGRFAIDAETGVVTVVSGSLLDFESATSHTVTVRASSSGGLFNDQTFVISVTDVNEPPSVPVDDDPAANSVAENAANGTSAGIMAFAVDPEPEDAVTYSLADDAGGRFAIDAGTGEVTVANGSLLDFEGAISHTVTVRATSSEGLFSEQTFTINITNVNEQPSVPTDANGAANQVAENATNGTAVGITASAVDPDAGDPVTYTLTDDAGGRFGIDASTGIVTVANGSLLDFESAASHQITVQASSSGGLNATQIFTINVTNANEPPSTPLDADDSPDTIGEDAESGATVGITTSAVDPDAGDTVTYSLTDDAGGRFAIDASTGVVTVADGSLLDFESAASHQITVQASSSGGLNSTETFTINVTNVNEAPTITSDGGDDTASVSVVEGSTVVTDVDAQDPDAGAALNFAIVGGADGGLFAIDSETGVLSFKAAPDFDAPADAGADNKYEVTVQASDGSLIDTQAITVTVTEAGVPAAVEDLGTVDENQQTAANGAAMKTTVTAAAGAVLTLQFNFLDSEPTADEAFFKDFAVVVVDGQVLTLADVADAALPVGAVTTNFDEQTGYLTFTLTFTESGTHELGIAVLNEGDTAFDAGLLVDSVSISGGAFSDGFESGLDGWTTLGNVTAQGTFEGVVPPQGSQQALLVSNGANSSAVETFLGLAPGTLSSVANQPVVTGNVLDNDDFGPDGPGGIVGIVYAGNPADVDDPNGTTDGDVTTIIAADGSWQLEFNVATGDYNFTVLAPIDHPGASEDSLAFAFTYTIEDATGDISAATLTIDVIDGVPFAFDDPQQIATEGGGAISGNVLANDQPSSDGAAVTEIQLANGSEPVTVPASGSVTVTTVLGGTLTISADGSWDYTPPATLPGTETIADGFSYTVTDGDGDTSSATQSILVQQGTTNQPPVMAAQSFSVAKGGTENIDAAELEATDPDNPPIQLVYTLTALPVLGTLLLSGAALGLNDTFTQQDIADGLLQYVQDGGSGVGDSFEVDVSDGTNTLAGQVISVAIVDPGVTSDGDTGVPNVDDPLIVSNTAFGQLNIFGGGSVLTQFGVIAGNEETGIGTIEVDGEGSSLKDFAGGITIGEAGTGQLLVENGATVLIGFGGANALDIGRQATGSGTVMVTGPGSSITTVGPDNAIRVGVGGFGSLSVLDGGLVKTLQLHIGVSGGGHVLIDGDPVDGPASRIIVSNDDGVFSGPNQTDAGLVSVAYESGAYGTLTIQNGGVLEIRSGESVNTDTVNPILGVGRHYGSSGIVQVTGEGSAIEISMTAPDADPGDVHPLLQGPGIALGIMGVGQMLVDQSATVTLTGDEAFISVGVGNFEDPEDTKQSGFGVLSVYNGATVTISDTQGGEGGLLVGDFQSGTGTVAIRFGSTMAIDSQGGADIGSEGTGILDVWEGSKLTIHSDSFNNLNIGASAGSYGLVRVDGKDSAIITTGTDNTVQVGREGEGILQVSNGGLVSTLQFEVGRSGTGTVTISGPGSKVIASNDGGLFSEPYAYEAGFVRVGRDYGSSGILTITNGGVLEIRPGETVNTDTHLAVLEVAREAGSVGAIVIDGAGSALVMEGKDAVAHIGRAGYGSLTITNGGDFVGGFLQFGRELGGTGTGLVSGDGSTITVQGDQSLNVGRYGDGVLTIQSGGVVTAAYINLGRQDTGVGEVIVTGSGSKLVSAGTTDSSLSVGRYGTGDLIISDGGSVEATNVSIGRYAGSQGDVLVTGAGSKLVTAGLDNNIQVGRQGTGTLTVQDGALVKTLNLAVAREGNGTVLIDGVGTKVIVSNDEGLFSEPYAYEAGFVRVSRNAGSSGSLTVTNGAELEIRSGIGQNEDTYAAALSIGRDQGSSGHVLVSGEGSLIRITQEVVPTGDLKHYGPYARVDGNSTLTVQDQGQIIIEGVYASFRVGDARYADAHVEVTGGGSILVDNKDVGGGLLVGGSFLGAATGSVHVGGAGSSIVLKGDGNHATIGFDSKGSLLIDGGGLVEADSLSAGQYYPGEGVVTVSGAGSSLKVDGAGGIQIGVDGDGELHVAGGATVLSTSDNFNNLDIAAGEYGSGLVTVDGGGSLIQTFGTDNTVQVGRYGEGKLEVTNGGVVSTLQFEVGRSGTGTVTIDGPGSKVIASNDGGLFSEPYAYEAGFVRVGRDDGSSGTLTITNGGVLEIRPGLGSGTYSAGMEIARDEGSSGIVTVSGPGSAIVISGDDAFFGVGRDGTGELHVDSGGSVSTLSMQIGRNGSGTVTVDGPGSEIIVSNDAGRFLGEDNVYAGSVSVGRNYGSSGELKITDGGRVEIRPGEFVNQDTHGATLSIGRYAGSTGVVSVEGLGSELVVSGDDAFLQVGRYGHGELHVSSGGVASTLTLEIGRYGTGIVTIDGPGSKIIASNDGGLSLPPDEEYAGFVRVGRADGSEGHLTITNGGVLEIRPGETVNTSTYYAELQIARDAGSVGTVVVSGKDEGSGQASSILMKGDGTFIQVGRDGDGSLSVENGGLVKTLNLQIGRYGSGHVTIDGSGSAIIVSNDDGLQVGAYSNNAGSVNVSRGDGSTGLLEVKNGGLLDIRPGLTENTDTVHANLIVGNWSPGSNGQVLVTGSGSHIRIRQNVQSVYGDFSTGAFLAIAGGQALVKVEQQGLLTVEGPGANIGIGGPDGTDSKLEILSGGKVEISGGIGGEAALFLSGEAGSTASVVISGSGSALTISGGSYSDVFAHVGYSGESQMIVTSGGKLTVGVSGDSVDEFNEIQFDKIDVQIFSNGTLDAGGGTIEGDVYIDNGGRLLAGDGFVAQASIFGNLLFNNATLSVDASANAQSDRYVVSGQADIWSGQFEFNFVGGYLPQDGHSFTFMQAAAINVDLSNVQFILNGISAGDAFSFNMASDGNFLSFASLANTTASDGLIYRGSSSDDVFAATTGHDELFGGVGNDQLSADAGDDLIVGGLGEDTLDGGSGADTFYFVDPSHGTFVTGNVTASSVGATGDLISNFEATTVGSVDTFQFSLANFNNITALDDDGWNFSVIGAEYDGTNATTSLVYDSAGHLIYDDNGADDGYTVLATVSPSSPPISADNLQTAA